MKPIDKQYSRGFVSKTLVWVIDNGKKIPGVIQKKNADFGNGYSSLVKYPSGRVFAIDKQNITLRTQKIKPGMKSVNRSCVRPQIRGTEKIMEKEWSGKL